MEPTKPAERIIEIDVLRGLAVLGMVLWDFRSSSMGSFHVSSGADHVVDRIVSFIDIQHTVHLLFAFIFGWGLSGAGRP